MDVGCGTTCPKSECCDYCRSGHKGLKKILETKEGLVVYQRTFHDVTDKSKIISEPRISDTVPVFSTTAAVSTKNLPDPTETEPDDKTVILIHNTNESDVRSEDILPEFNIDDVSCPRCRFKMRLAKKLLASVPIVEKKDVRSVCELCKLKQLSLGPCHVCQSVIREYKALGFKEGYMEDYMKKKIMKYIANTKRFLKSKVAIDERLMVRSFSAHDITKFIERREYDQRLRRPKSGPLFDSTSKYLKERVELENVIEKKRVEIRADATTVIPKKEISTDEMDLVLDDLDRILLKPILKTAVSAPATQQEVKKPDYLDVERTPYRSGDVIKTKAKKSETVLGVGTTGMMRRAHSDESLITSFTGITAELFKKNLKYFFPRIIKKDKEDITFKTSAELIKDTQDKFKAQDRLKSAKKLQKQEEIQKAKIKKEEEEIRAKEKLKRKIELAKREGIIPPDDDISYEIDKKTGLLVVKKKGKKKSDLEGKKTLGKKEAEGRKKDTEGRKIETDERKKTGKERKESDAKKIKGKGKREFDGKDKSKTLFKEKGKQGYDMKMITSKGKLKEKWKQESGVKLIKGKRKFVGKGEQESSEKITSGKSKREKQPSAGKGKQQMAGGGPLLANLLKSGPEQKPPPKPPKMDKPVSSKPKVTLITEDKKVGEDVPISEEKIVDKKDIPDYVVSDGMMEPMTVQSQKLKILKEGEPEEKMELAKEIKDYKRPPKVEPKVDKRKPKKSDLKKTEKEDISPEEKADGKVTKEHVKLLNKVLAKQEKIIAGQTKLKSAQQSKLQKIKEQASKATQLKPEVYEDLTFKKEPPKEIGKPGEKPTEKPQLLKKLEVPLENIKMKYSGDDLLMKLIRVRTKDKGQQAIPKKPIEALPPIRHRPYYKKPVVVVESGFSIETISEKEVSDIIVGNTVTKLRNIPIAQESSPPALFQTIFDGRNFPEGLIGEDAPSEPLPPTGTEGIFRYALSDRTFIENGWTLLPEEKIIRKMNVYRMRPTQPVLEWFKYNTLKGPMQYESGQKLAEFEDNGRGRWYYKNGRIALDYYDSEEANAQQRFVIYSSGDVDNRGRTQPITVLGMFDYNGNGIVFDHNGKIRLKYNQSEGVLLDRAIGPVSHWKWHSLNDPPELQQVMIDTQLNFKDPDIAKLAEAERGSPREEDEQMLAIEFENFIKSKNIKPSHKFEPFQIRLKALKINDQFSLRVLDQKTIYLQFRDGSTKLKLNLGMELDHNNIIDTSTCELGQVKLTMENQPAVTESIENLQKMIAKTHGIMRVRREQELWKRPAPPGSSADKLIAAASKPLRKPLQTIDPASSQYKVPSANNLYYNTRLI